MHIQVKPSTSGKTFSVEFCNKEGDKAFFAINGCRIAQGKDGEFVSGPSTKMDDGKWFNYAYFNEKLGAKILELASDMKPAKPAKQAEEDIDLPF